MVVVVVSFVEDFGELNFGEEGAVEFVVNTWLFGTKIGGGLNAELCCKGGAAVGGGNGPKVYGCNRGCSGSAAVSAGGTIMSAVLATGLLLPVTDIINHITYTFSR